MDNLKSQQVKRNTQQSIRQYSQKTWHVSLLLSLLLTYPFRHLFQDESTGRYNVLPAVLVVFGLTFMIMWAIRILLRKLPITSRWHFWLD